MCSESGRGPAVGRLVWDQEVASSILAAPTRYNLATSFSVNSLPKIEG